MRVAAAVQLNSDEKAELQKLIRRCTTAVRVVERFRIVLSAANGLQNLQISRQLEIAPRMAARWRSRFLALGISSLLKDAQCSGRKPTISAATVAEVVRRSTQSIPDKATHWSRSIMARETGVSDSTIGRIWRTHGLKPH